MTGRRPEDPGRDGAVSRRCEARALPFLLLPLAFVRWGPLATALAGASTAAVALTTLVFPFVPPGFPLPWGSFAAPLLSEGLVAPNLLHLVWRPLAIVVPFALVLAAAVVATGPGSASPRSWRERSSGPPRASRSRSWHPLSPPLVVQRGYVEEVYFTREGALARSMPRGAGASEAPGAEGAGRDPAALSVAVLTRQIRKRGTTRPLGRPVGRPRIERELEERDRVRRGRLVDAHGERLAGGRARPAGRGGVGGEDGAQVGREEPAAAGLGEDPLRLVVVRRREEACLPSPAVGERVRGGRVSGERGDEMAGRPGGEDSFDAPGRRLGRGGGIDRGGREGCGSVRASPRGRFPARRRIRRSVRSAAGPGGRRAGPRPRPPRARDASVRGGRGGREPRPGPSRRTARGSRRSAAARASSGRGRPRRARGGGGRRAGGPRGRGRRGGGRSRARAPRRPCGASRRPAVVTRGRASAMTPRKSFG